LLELARAHENGCHRRLGEEPGQRYLRRRLLHFRGYFLYFIDEALDEWFGRHVGLFDPEASDLLAQCERVLGDAVGKSRSSFQKKLEKAILGRSPRKTKSADKRAAAIADVLWACGMTWKHSLASRQEFSEKMRDAIHLCCRDL
jgi:hypothetical protein